jgi:hypothetical protein
MDNASRQLVLPLTNPSETIDVYVAARIARVSMETIRRWCDLQLFPSWKLVGRWKIDRAGFETWLYRVRTSARS